VADARAPRRGPTVQKRRTQVKPAVGHPDDPDMRRVRDVLASLDRATRLALCGTVALSGASFALAVHGLPGVAS